MKLVLTHSPKRARTLWTLLGRTDEWVAQPIPPAAVAITSVDRDAFSAITRLNTKILGSISTAVSQATEIWVAQTEQEHQFDWHVSALVSAYAPKAAVLTLPASMNAESIQSALRARQPYRANPDALDYATIDWIVDDTVGRPFRKQFGKQFELGLLDLAVLERVHTGGQLDLRAAKPSVPVTDRLVDTIAFLVTNDTKRPEEVMESLRDAIDLGLMCEARTEQDAQRIQSTYEKHFKKLGRNPPDPTVWADAVAPANPDTDMAKWPPEYRSIGMEAYTRLYRNAYTERSTPHWECSPAGLVARLEQAPARVCAAIGRLRRAGLLWGWSYMRVTDYGRALLAGLPEWVDGTFLGELQRTTTPRNTAAAIDALSYSTELQSGSRCYCGTALVVSPASPNFQLFCPECQKKYWACVDKDVVKLMEPDTTYWWCSTCKAVRLHTIESGFDNPTLTCREPHG